MFSGCLNLRVENIFNAMLSRGIYLAPSQFEAIFVSTAHTIEDLDKTISAIEESLRKIFH